MAFRTTGPLYIEPHFRNGDNRFGLLLSNLTGESQTVTVEQFGAPFTAPDAPETWTSIRFTSHTIPTGTVANLVIPIQPSTRTISSSSMPLAGMYDRACTC